MIYLETLEENLKIRQFNSDIEHFHLVWHFDEYDRIVEVLNDSDWKFQFENKLPFDLTKGLIFKIKKGVYHRLIKGETDLKIKIIENEEI